MVDYASFPDATTLHGGSLGSVVHSTLHGNLGAAAADLNGRLTIVEGTTNHVSYARAYGHSWGTRGSLSWASQYVGIDLFAQQLKLASSYWKNHCVFGERVIDGTPSTAGRVLGTTTAGELWLGDAYASPWMTTYNDPNYAIPYPNRGLSLLLTGSSDINGFSTTDPNHTATLEGLRWAFRSMIARLQATRVHESTDGSVGITLGGGTWTNLSSTRCNSGSGYSYNPTAGASVTVATGANFAGGTVDLGFVNGYVGSAGAASVGSLLKVYVDGVENTTYPGYPLNTKDVIPSIAGANAPAVITLKNLAAGNRTILVTCATGGMAFDYWGIRSTYPKAAPVIVCDTSLLPAAGYNAGSDAKFTDFNTMIEGIAAECDNVAVAHLSSFVGKADVNFYPGDHLHFSDVGQYKVCAALWDAMKRLDLTNSPMI